MFLARTEMLSLVTFSAFQNINICIKYYCMTPMFGETWSTYSIIIQFKKLKKKVVRYKKIASFN